MKTGRASPKNALVRSCLTWRRAQQGVAVSRSHAQLPTRLSFLKRTWDGRKSLKQFREGPPHPWRGLAASHKWTVRTRGIHDYLGRDIHLLSNLRTPGGIRRGARPQNSHYLCHFVAQFPWKPSKEGCPAIRQKLYIRRTFSGNSLVVQWVSLWALTAKSLSSIPGQGTKIRQAA